MALTAPLVWLDGKVVPVARATLPLMAHAAQRGSLVFDVGAWHRTPRGRALFRVDAHVERLLHSASVVGIELPYDHDALKQAAIDVINANDPRTDGLVRWSVFFAAGEPDLLPRSNSAHVAVAAQTLKDPPRARPLRIATFPDAIKAPPAALDPTAKAAAAYLGPMIAKRRAIAAGADDVVLLDGEGNIAEAPIANVFVVRNEILITPPLGAILPGITRRSVLEIARNLGIATREEPISRAEFQGASEAFLTGTSLPLAPIGVIDGLPLPAKTPVTSRLADALRSVRRDTHEGYASWLTFT